MKYFLFVFAKHEKNQEKFVKTIAEDILCVSDDVDVNYYFGPESVIYTFTSKEIIDDLKEFFKMILGSTGIVYFMIPFEPDKMSYWLDPSIEKLLLKTDKTTEKPKFIDESILKVQKLLFETLDFDEEITPIKTKTISLDDLLDKIIDFGFDSLTIHEKKLLENYSK